MLDVCETLRRMGAVTGLDLGQHCCYIPSRRPDMTIALLLLVIAAVCATLALFGIAARVNLNSIAILLIVVVLFLGRGLA